MDIVPKNREPPPPGSSAGITERVWRFFSSIKLALILILVIGAFSLVGAFLPDIDMFHSWWFLGAGALLTLNIFVCSVNRWSNIRNSLNGGAIKQKDTFYTTGNSRAEISAVPQGHAEAAKIPGKVLRQHGYRVRVENDKDHTYIAADKNRYFRLGTYVSHLSLILLVLAYILGSYLGFRNLDFTIAEGETREIGYNTGLAVKLISFVDEYYPDNTPKDYRSEVILYENGQEVRQAQVRVNYPLSYKGVRIYQSFFGSAVRMQIRQGDIILFQGNVPLDNVIESQGIQRYVGFIEMPGTGLTIRLIGSAVNASDPMIPRGQLAVDMRQNGTQVGLKLAQKGVPVTINDTEFTYQADTRFSGFQVSSDPANVFIWIASSLFILGISLVFYFPYRQIWVLSKSQTAGNTQMLIRMGAAKGFNASELESLAKEIRKNLR